MAWLYGGGFVAVLLALMAGGVVGMRRNAAARPPKPSNTDELFIDHTLADPALQAEIMRRCAALPALDEPSEVANDLGLVELPDGSSLRAWLVHAADAVLLDEFGQTVLITRLHNPGRGKLALPGGMLDTTPLGLEPSRTAALREATEETGIDPALLAQAKVTQLGTRRYVRPFDIRRAWNNLPGTPVQKGELFSVSTLGFRVTLKGNLHDYALKAGDDATAVTILSTQDVTALQLAVPDHLELLHAAQQAP